MVASESVSELKGWSVRCMFEVRPQTHATQQLARD
jgi:hypothetical protein